MKRSILAAVLAPLVLPACAQADHFVFHDAFGEAHGRGVNERQYRADLHACDGGAGSEWCRVAADDGNLDRDYPLDLKPAPKGLTHVYDPSQCDGTMENGLCRGVLRPRLASPPVCHGEIIDGVCAGPVF